MLAGFDFSRRKGFLDEERRRGQIVGGGGETRLLEDEEIRD